MSKYVQEENYVSRFNNRFVCWFIYRRMLYVYFILLKRLITDDLLQMKNKKPSFCDKTSFSLAMAGVSRAVVLKETESTNDVAKEMLKNG